jgi:hypothetical protein
MKKEGNEFLYICMTILVAVAICLLLAGRGHQYQERIEACVAAGFYQEECENLDKDVLDAVYYKQLAHKVYESKEDIQAK